MRAISVMIKPASGLCNMKCDYCFYCDEAANRQQASYGLMEESTLKNVIRRTLTHVTNDYSLAFQGGEPTLRGLPFFEKAVAYTKQYNRNGAAVHFALQTNGYALTEEWARFFAENNFLIGVSVDGTEEIHDTYRHLAGYGKDQTQGSGSSASGSGTFKRVMESIRLLEKYHVEYNILTVVHRMTAENIREIYAFYKKKHWHYLQFIPCLDPLDQPPGQCAYSLLPETYGRFLTDLFDLWYEDFKRGEAPYIRQLENFLGILLGYRPEACDQRGRCGLQYVAEADGSVYPCDFYMLDEWRLGNFNTDRLDVIDEARLTKHFLERSDALDEECRNCPWLSLCRGGCYRHRTEIPGNNLPGRKKNYFCRGYQMFFETCSERLKDMAVRVSGGQSL